MDPRQLSHYIELLFLTITWLSVLTCLIRTDYNFPFALFCYYLWISRDDKANSLMLIVLNGVLCLVDIIWLLSVGSIWTSDQTKNEVWIHLHGLHVFVMMISVLNMFLKAIAIFALNTYREKQTQLGNLNDQSQIQQQPVY